MSSMKMWVMIKVWGVEVYQHSTASLNVFFPTKFLAEVFYLLLSFKLFLSLGSGASIVGLLAVRRYFSLASFTLIGDMAPGLSIGQVR